MFQRYTQRSNHSRLGDGYDIENAGRETKSNDSSKGQNRTEDRITAVDDSKSYVTRCVRPPKRLQDPTEEIWASEGKANAPYYDTLVSSSFLWKVTVQSLETVRVGLINVLY
jgi:hypothetical protein